MSKSRESIAILMADDDPDDRRLTQKALEKALLMALWMAHERVLWTELLTAPCPWTPLTSLSMPCHPPPPLVARPPVWALD